MVEFPYINSTTVIGYSSMTHIYIRGSRMQIMVGFNWSMEYKYFLGRLFSENQPATPTSSKHVRTDRSCRPIPVVYVQLSRRPLCRTAIELCTSVCRCRALLPSSRDTTVRNSCKTYHGHYCLCTIDQCIYIYIYLGPTLKPAGTRYHIEASSRIRQLL